MAEEDGHMPVFANPAPTRFTGAFEPLGMSPPRCLATLLCGVGSGPSPGRAGFLAAERLVFADWCGSGQRCQAAVVDAGQRTQPSSRSRDRAGRRKGS